MKSFDSIRKLWRQRPFVPFRVVTDTGQRYDILTPDQIMVTKTTLAVARRKNKRDPVFDSVHHLGVLNVESIEPINSQSTSK